MHSVTWPLQTATHVPSAVFVSRAAGANALLLANQIVKRGALALLGIGAGVSGATLLAVAAYYWLENYREYQELSSRGVKLGPAFNQLPDDLKFTEDLFLKVPPELLGELWVNDGPDLPDAPRQTPAFQSALEGIKVSASASPLGHSLDMHFDPEVFGALMEPRPYVIHPRELAVGVGGPAESVAHRGFPAGLARGAGLPTAHTRKPDVYLPPPKVTASVSDLRYLASASPELASVMATAPAIPQTTVQVGPTTKPTLSQYAITMEFLKAHSWTTALTANPLQQDVKVESAMAYVAMQRMVTKTFGTATEILDAFSIFREHAYVMPHYEGTTIKVPSMYEDEGTYEINLRKPQSLASLPLRAQAMALWEYASSDNIDIRVDLEGFAQAALLNELQDRAIAISSMAERRMMNDIGIGNTGLGQFGNVSTWTKRAENIGLLDTGNAK